MEHYLSMTAQNAVFLFVLVLGAGFFALNVQRLVSYLQLGYAENRTDHPLVRLRNVFEIGIAQKKIFRDPVAGPMHALIFWGFMVLTAGTIEILIAGVVPAFSYALYDESNIRLRTDVEGGALMDVGCYNVSGSRLLGGEPERVWGDAWFGPLSTSS